MIAYLRLETAGYPNPRSKYRRQYMPEMQTSGSKSYRLFACFPSYLQVQPITRGLALSSTFQRALGNQITEVTGGRGCSGASNADVVFGTQPTEKPFRPGIEHADQGFSPDAGSTGHAGGPSLWFWQSDGRSWQSNRFGLPAPFERTRVASL